MLNSFLQFLDEDQSGSVIIAATNHRSLLDPAIFRRFHAAFVYTKPSTEEARQDFRKVDTNFRTKILLKQNSLSRHSLASQRTSA